MRFGESGDSFPHNGIVAANEFISIYERPGRIDTRAGRGVMLLRSLTEEDPHVSRRMRVARRVSTYRFKTENDRIYLFLTAYCDLRRSGAQELMPAFQSIGPRRHIVDVERAVFPGKILNGGRRSNMRDRSGERTGGCRKGTTGKMMPCCFPPILHSFLKRYSSKEAAMVQWSGRSVGIWGLLLLLLMSCTNDQPPPGVSAVSPWLAAYPLAIGNRWDYDRTIAWDNIRIIDSSACTPFEPAAFLVSVSVTRTLKLPADEFGSGDSVLVTEFRTDPGEPLVGESFDYYEQSEEALLFHGYIGGSITTPRLWSMFALSINGVRYSSMDDLYRALGLGRPASGGEITREYPPLTALAYPLQTGDTWTYRSDRDPFGIDKSVVSVRDSVIDRRVTRVTIVRWLYDLDKNGVWDENISVTDYFSADGLLRRTAELKDIGFTSSSSPDPVAYADVTDDLIIRFGD